MIKNGVDADQTNLNAAFVSRTADTSTTGKVSLNNSADTNSGGLITNAQRAINETFDAVGINGEGDASRKSYSSTAYVASGDSHKVAIGKLDAQAMAQTTAPVAATQLTGQVSIAQGGTGQSLKAPAFDALTPATTEGDIVLRGTTASVRLGVGATAQVLTADTTVTGKVKWAAPAPANLTGATGTLPIANGGTGSTTASAAFDALAPTTTKADLIVRSATTASRLPIGTDAQVLTADSTQALGVKWATVSAANPNVSNATGTLPIANGGTGQTTATAALNALLPAQTAGRVLTSDGTNATFAQPSVASVTGTLAIGNGGTGATTSTAAFNAIAPTTTSGDLIAYNGGNVRLPVGTQGQVLTVDTTTPGNIKWATVGAAANVYAWYAVTNQANVTAGGVVLYPTKIEDASLIYNPSTGSFGNLPLGRYRASFVGQSLSGTGSLYITVGGTAVGFAVTLIAANAVLSATLPFRVTAANQTVQIRSDAAFTIKGTATPGGYTNQFIIERVGD